jgi:hypothetical protein
MNDARGVSADEFLRIALALPEVERGGEWNGIKVRGKGFCYLDEDEDIALLKATREEQAALVADDPRAYEASRVTPRFGWVRIRLACARREEIAELVTEAWRLTAPKRLVEAYDSARSAPPVRVRPGPDRSARPTTRTRP